MIGSVLKPYEMHFLILKPYEMHLQNINPKKVIDTDKFPPVNLAADQFASPLTL